METYGWGRFPKTDAEITAPRDAAALQAWVRETDGRAGHAIVRGAGRSYGDSALAPQILSSRYLDHFCEFDDEGRLRCSGGVTLGHILDNFVPRGWFLPVIPGTRFVTVGGAIASDIHGKNHHLDGCFGNFVESFQLLLATGDILTCSREENTEIFRATCGGMGLTGIVLEAVLRLRAVNSSAIRQQTFQAQNLDGVFGLFDANPDSTYSVAWLDCMARGDALGRSLLFLGEHASATEDGGGPAQKRDRQSGASRSVTVPFTTPAFLLNKFSMSLFNACYFKLAANRKDKLLDYAEYFFPLDRFLHWNRLYGRNGFLQYQFVIPQGQAREGIGAVLKEVTEQGKGSFLSVLKKLGEHNDHYLSFPLEGYTLALDFKYEKSLPRLLDRLDRIVLSHGGRLYLAKDARMSKDTFRQGYPKWEKFIAVKRQVDPDCRFASLQARRLGLCPDAL
ncbi:MAG: FAD-binding oxidoreductase [Pseudohongiellaceae bacterium]